MNYRVNHLIFFTLCFVIRKDTMFWVGLKNIQQILPPSFRIHKITSKYLVSKGLEDDNVIDAHKCLLNSHQHSFNCCRVIIRLR